MFGNISKTTVSTFGVIIIAAAIVDILIIFIIRYLPRIFGKEINIWYTKFGLSAVLADVLSITLGVVIGQFIYRQAVEPSLGWSLLAFLGVVVAFQLCHDLLFALFVIYPIPQGHNGMIDVFKSYANYGKYRILLVDATMMILTTLLASFLYTQPAAVTIVTGSFALYSLPYILTTRNEFSDAI